MGFIAAVGIALLFPQVIRSISTTGSVENKKQFHMNAKTLQ